MARVGRAAHRCAVAPVLEQEGERAKAQPYEEDADNRPLPTRLHICVGDRQRAEDQPGHSDGERDGLPTGRPALLRARQAG